MGHWALGGGDTHERLTLTDTPPMSPQLLGSHHHAEGTQAGGSPVSPTPSAPTAGAGGDAGEGGPPWVALGVLGGLYSAFLLEKLLGILLPPGGEVRGGQGGWGLLGAGLGGFGGGVWGCVGVWEVLGGARWAWGG